MLWAFNAFLFVSYWIMLVFGFVGYVAVGAATVGFVVQDSTVEVTDRRAPPHRVTPLYKYIAFAIGVCLGLVWWLYLPIRIGAGSFMKWRRV